MGDHHQPMHICSLYNEKFPKGDNGGLYFNITINKGLLTKEYDSKNIKLKEKERLIHNRLNKNDFKNKDEKSITTNLHEYWNYLFYKINNISLPLEKQGENEINFFSKSIMTEYSRENLTDEIEFDSINMNKNYDINMKKLKNKEALNVKNMHMKEIKNLEYKFLVENSKNLSNEEDYDEYIRRLSIYLKSRIEEWTLENYNICKVIYKELLCESCDTISRTTLDNFYSISKKQLALAAYRTSNIIQNSYDIMLLKKELNKLKGKVNEKKYFSNTWYYVAGVIILKIVLFR